MIWFIKNFVVSREKRMCAIVNRVISESEDLSYQKYDQSNTTRSEGLHGQLTYTIEEDAARF